VDLRTRTLPNGEWRMYARVGRDRFGDLELPLVAGRRGPLEPASRLARAVVLPRRQVGEPLELASRGSLVRRLVRRVHRLIK
jgi:hypothetical protein